MRDGLGRGLVYIVLEKNNQNKKNAQYVASVSHCFPEEPFWNMVCKAIRKSEDKGSLEIDDTARSLVIASKTCFA